jgi:hypothetical protein
MKKEVREIAERYTLALEKLNGNSEIDLWHCAVIDELTHLLGSDSLMIHSLRNSFTYKKDDLKRLMGLLLIFMAENESSVPPQNPVD